MKIQSLILIAASALLCAQPASAYENNGNQFIRTFGYAKKMLETKVYQDHRKTLYCNATFDENKNIVLPSGFKAPKDAGNTGRMNWEHVVPVRHFGQTFTEWREGAPACVDPTSGQRFKGRRCAEQVNAEFRYMMSDLYNLYPAIMAVNSFRGNTDFDTVSDNTPSEFGSCDMKTNGEFIQPPKEVRGVIARTYKYMDASYSRYHMSPKQSKLMDAWDKLYPVTRWECVRAQRIEKIQRNSNEFVKQQCIERNLWN